MKNRQVLLASRPQGEVTESNFRIVDAPVGEPGDGRSAGQERVALARSVHARPDERREVLRPAGGDRRSDGRADRRRGRRVEASALSRGRQGADAAAGWQLYGVVKGDELQPIDTRRVPASCYLGVLGMPGITAWFGLFDIGAPKAGETVVVSAASGAVGSVVGQLAKIHGCRAVGIAGGRAKCDYVVRELGFDACVDHRGGALAADLSAACPNGVDVNFENVGGAVLDTLLALMNRAFAHRRLRPRRPSTTRPSRTATRACARCSSTASACRG